MRHAMGARKGALARLWPFLGPAFIASVAYIDPGNFATNIQGGAKFGYTLLCVILLLIIAALRLDVAKLATGDCFFSTATGAGDRGGCAGRTVKVTRD
jgi:Mn2+/Fe2+ NRAMP family transporter